MLYPDLKTCSPISFLHYNIYKFSQYLLLFWRKIFLYILWIGKQKIDFFFLNNIQIYYSSTTALASSFQFDAKFSRSSQSLNDSTFSWILKKYDLKFFRSSSLRPITFQHLINGSVYTNSLVTQYIIYDFIVYDNAYVFYNRILEFSICITQVTTDNWLHRFTLSLLFNYLSAVLMMNDNLMLKHKVLWPSPVGTSLYRSFYTKNSNFNFV